MAMFTIDYLDFEQSQVYFSSEYSAFRASFQINEYDDVWMDGEIEHKYNRVDVTVYSNAVCYVAVDDDVVLDIKLTDDMCRELASLIEQELKKRLILFF